MDVRKAGASDIDSIEQIYERAHDDEQRGASTVGWVRGIYPTRQTAIDSLARGDLFVMLDGDMIVAVAIINQIQVPEYKLASWKHTVKDDEVMVLHTLVVDPHAKGRGYGRAFVDFYESYARECGCYELRMDTNEKNTRARQLYKYLGYDEVGIVPCTFNGISGVQLVCLEKRV